MRAPEQDPAPDCPQSGASRLLRSLPPDGYRSGSGLFADMASVPTGLEISGPFADIGPCAHWPGDPGPLPDMTVPGFTHGAVRASTLFDGSQHAHFGTHG